MDAKQRVDPEAAPLQPQESVPLQPPVPQQQLVQRRGRLGQLGQLGQSWVFSMACTSNGGAGANKPVPGIEVQTDHIGRWVMVSVSFIRQVPDAE
jgi:hypothetical protein